MTANNCPSVLLNKQLQALQGVDNYMSNEGLDAARVLFAALSGLFVAIRTTSRDSPSLSAALRKFAGQIIAMNTALLELEPELRCEMNNLPALIAAAEQQERFSRQVAVARPPQPGVRRRA